MSLCSKHVVQWGWNSSALVWPWISLDLNQSLLLQINSTLGVLWFTWFRHDLRRMFPLALLPSLLEVLLLYVILSGVAILERSRSSSKQIPRRVIDWFSRWDSESLIPIFWSRLIDLAAISKYLLIRHLCSELMGNIGRPVGWIKKMTQLYKIIQVIWSRICVHDM